MDSDKKKYEPLGAYLKALSLSVDSTTLTFSEIEKIIQDILPASATEYRQWWANQEGGSRAPHWHTAGFKVDHVDQERKVVRFKRMHPTNEGLRAQPQDAQREKFKAWLESTHKKDGTEYSRNTISQYLSYITTMPDFISKVTGEKFSDLFFATAEEGEAFFRQYQERIEPLLIQADTKKASDFKSAFQGYLRFLAEAEQRRRPRALSLQEVLVELNERSIGRPFGNIQEWRKEHKGFKRLASKAVFDTDIAPDRNYQFHHGGLIELQFNVGFERVDGVVTFRHGVAFSLQRTREFTDIAQLMPSLNRFNEYFSTYPNAFPDMEMWHFQKGQRSHGYPIGAIPDALIQEGNFILLGKKQPVNAIDVGLILDDFDALLPLYEFVEDKTASFPLSVPSDQRAAAFVFSPGNKARAVEITINRTAQTIEKKHQHNILQSAIYEHLDALHRDNVSGEQRTVDGTCIDIVVRDGEAFTYYEIKTALSARECIRQALGQLLEYAYWPKATSAHRLVVVGKPPLDKEAKAYLATLNDKFSIPIEYQQFDEDLACLVTSP